MTDSTEPSLPRPAPAHDRGPRDDTFYDLVEARLRRLVRDNPVFGTALGLHALDDELGDGGREAVLAELEADRRHLAQVEAIDPADLSASARFERDLELHNVRRAIFDADVLRIWERRSFALDTVGDGLFLLFARDHAPLADRLAAIAGRLEAVPLPPRPGAVPRGSAAGPDLAAHRARDRRRAARRSSTRSSGRPMGSVAGPERRRLERAVGCGQGRSGPVRDLARGHPRRRLRRLAHRPRAARCAGRPSRVRRARCRRDPRARLAEARRGEGGARRPPPARSIRTRPRPRWSTASSRTSRPTSTPRSTAYRTAMLRSRDHLIEHDLVTVPPDERIEVIETPEYLRNVIPFAAYFEPGDVRRRSEGHLRRHAIRRTATPTRCASTTWPRSATRASTRRIRATISSWIPRDVTRRSPG